MNFSAAALRLMAEKGLSLLDVADIVAANDVRADPTSNERQRRCRANKKANGHTVTVTRDKGSNDRDILTSKDLPQTANAVLPQGAKPWALPVGVSLQIWSDFLDNRKRKRLGKSDTAWTHFLGDLKRVSSQTGIPPPQLIEQCTAKGWGAIYDPRNERNERSSNPTGDAVSNVLRRIGADH